MRIIMSALLGLMLTGCESGGGSSGAASAPASDGTAVPITPPAAPVASQGSQSSAVAVQVTYHSLTRTTAPVQGWQSKTITMTGSCLVYLTKTYCWDDGVKTLQWSSNNSFYGPFTYTYWGLNQNGQGMGICFGGCPSDLMSAPRLISNAVGTNITQSSLDTGNTVNDVFNLGVSHQLQCSEDNGVLDCGTFSVSLAQVAL